MNVLKKIKSYYFAVSILYIVIGLIMLLNPKFVCDAVNYIIGSLVMLYGIVYLVGLYQQREFELLNKFNFLAGVMCISFGVFLILNSSVLMSLIPFCAGVIILIDAIYQLRHSLSLKLMGNKYWYINLVVGIFFLLFAIFVMTKSENITQLLIRFIGGVLILDAIMDFYTYFALKKINKNKNDLKVIEVKEEA